MFPNIGVDLLHLPRLSTLLVRRKPTYLARFARRILTDNELGTFTRKLGEGGGGLREDTVRWLGVRWAAKEAAFKAGGINRRLMWKEVEVRYLASGQPYLQLIKENVTGGLSISHDGEYVVAMAMLPPSVPEPVEAEGQEVAGAMYG
ncbi:4'-phosphopantetheinyl transferase superfamily [Pyronema domesticum]|uniref:Similar to Putative holo-[acyl-carrier-protein] synthase acc. no. G2TRL9 n=1 Tax=Pyronema omphalodes (strain CBS 100304) TaxID=1076935 RepID=U4L2W7_PYROM|nr:4'-phosphopantetheinyl transferase superfamily [Pyronema domesticum]CCX09695.1 Similar to Putative holo-[acyl-carrier-protein] synthase; acc. no. G2TRL9 [Pyronema omphalodes CBS 100304]